MMVYTIQCKQQLTSEVGTLLTQSHNLCLPLSLSLSLSIAIHWCYPSHLWSYDGSLLQLDGESP